MKYYLYVDETQNGNVKQKYKQLLGSSANLEYYRVIMNNDANKFIDYAFNLELINGRITRALKVYCVYTILRP